MGAAGMGAAVMGAASSAAAMMGAMLERMVVLEVAAKVAVVVTAAKALPRPGCA